MPTWTFYTLLAASRDISNTALTPRLLASEGKCYPLRSHYFSHWHSAEQGLTSRANVPTLNVAADVVSLDGSLTIRCVSFFHPSSRDYKINQRCVLLPLLLLLSNLCCRVFGCGTLLVRVIEQCRQTSDYSKCWPVRVFISLAEKIVDLTTPRYSGDGFVCSRCVVLFWF